MNGTCITDTFVLSYNVSTTHVSALQGTLQEKFLIKGHKLRVKDDIIVMRFSFSSLTYYFRNVGFVQWESIFSGSVRDLTIWWANK